jgi:hypothetical protein
MRTDATAPTQEQAPPNPASPLSEAPPPWQVPGEGQGQGVAPESLESPAGEKEGGFPAIIFVVLILGIIIAIVAFLFTQGALPFIS